MIDASFYPGKTIGKCRIEKLIGQGGMAYVFSAMHEELHLQRAVKILKPIDESTISISKSLLIERFIREARIAARLDHKNIIRIHDVGSLDETHYIEMEYLAGRTLRKFIKDSSAFIDQKIAAAIIYMCADAISYAHTENITFQGVTVKGLIHRDLKPDNIFITETGDLKVLDFGIAKLDNMSLTTSTEARNVTGTLAYMSPEQLDGKPLTKASDLFSLGTLFYELLTKKNPFLAEETSKTIKSIFDADYAPLSKVRGDLDKDFPRIIEGCLKADPKDRFGSAAEIKQIAFSMLVRFGILEPADAFKNYIMNGNFAVTSSIRLPRRRKFSLSTSLVLATIFMVIAILVKITYFNSPITSKEESSRPVVPKSSLAAAFEGADTTSVQIKDSLSGQKTGTSSPAPDSGLKAPSRASGQVSPVPDRSEPKNPLQKPQERPKKALLSHDRPGNKPLPLKVSSAPVPAALPATPSPIDSARAYLNSGRQLDAIRLLLSCSSVPADLILKFPESEAAFHFFKGLNAFQEKNYTLAASFFESCVRKATSFKPYRLTFISNSVYKKALSYTALYESGEKDAKGNAISSWEGVLKMTKDSALKTEAQSALKDLKK